MPLLLSPFTPVFDQSGHLRTDAQVYVYSAGTTTPALIYLDSDFGAPAPNPVATVGGILPTLYAPSGSYRIRAVDGSNATLRDFDDIVVGSTAVSGGGGGGTVDATTVFSTGDLKKRYGTGEVAGWVRLNGRTIGPAASGASERASADTEALYTYLWGADTALAVSGGRGASAGADWAAAKTLALPDLRGRLLGGLDDMGNAAAGRLAGGTITAGTATTLGSYGGTASQTLTVAQLPTHTPTGTVTVQAGGSHSHTIYYRYTNYEVPPTGTAALTNRITPSNGTWNDTTVSGTVVDHTHPATLTMDAVGSSQAFSLLPPFVLVTVYIKL